MMSITVVRTADEHRGYSTLDSFYAVARVNHGRDEYRRGKASTNASKASGRSLSAAISERTTGGTASTRNAISILALSG